MNVDDLIERLTELSERDNPKVVVKAKDMWGCAVEIDSVERDNGAIYIYLQMNGT